MSKTPKYSAEARLRDTLLNAGIFNPDALIDAFRDEVPGRTITESEAARLWYDANNSIRDAWPMSLQSQGITVTPDPEPTNAEKWNAIVDEWRKTVSPYPSSASFGEWMDQRGVKAPNHD